MKNKEYYFQYVVPNHTEELFSTIKDARKRAKELNEKVYLSIFSKNNTFGECYDEVVITDNSNVIDCKLRLIKSFNKLTNI